MLLIGITINQLKSSPEGSSALGLPVTTGAYVYTLIFVSDMGSLLLITLANYFEVMNALNFHNIY